MEGTLATRWLVVLGRRFQPQLRFLWDRVTPGGTFGLEFTSLMATLAVSLFVLIAYAVVLGREPGPTPGDITAMEIVEAASAPAGSPTWRRSSPHLGSAIVTWGLASVCAVVLGHADGGGRSSSCLIAGMT